MKRGKHGLTLNNPDYINFIMTNVVVLCQLLKILIYISIHHNELYTFFKCCKQVDFNIQTCRCNNLANKTGVNCELGLATKLIFCLILTS